MLSLVLICVYLLSYFTIGASFDLQFIFICKLVCLDQVQFYVFFMKSRLKRHLIVSN